jgi:hypothetical protein
MGNQNRTLFGVGKQFPVIFVAKQTDITPYLSDSHPGYQE